MQAPHACDGARSSPRTHHADGDATSHGGTTDPETSGRTRHTGAEIICELILREGVSTVVGLPGGAILPVYDALARSKLVHVLARHEQGAAYIAHGMARATGRAAVCLATSGPGATNLVTALADARMDSIPLVAITGQVPSSLIGTDAFQEVDTLGLAIPVTKHAFMARSACELLDIVPRAFAIAESGRPGPVWIDVPKDVQQAAIEIDAWPRRCARDAPPPRSDDSIRALADAIGRAERPVIFAGGGVVASGAAPLLRALVARQDIPCVQSLMGLGAFPGDDPRSLGMAGMHGSLAMHAVLDEADLLVGLGVRFDDRVTGTVRDFCPRATIAHVDIDAAEIGKIVRPSLAIRADVAAALSALLPRLGRRTRRAWWARVRAHRAHHAPATPRCVEPTDALTDPRALIDVLASALPRDALVTTDVGQHQMWVAQRVPFRAPRSLLTSGGLGAMGFGLPAAIGAALAQPKRRVVCVTGDGSLLINLQELATLAELDLDVVILLMNNRHLGLVRQQQELFYRRRLSACSIEREPAWCTLAHAFGIPALDLGKAPEPARALMTALGRRGPLLVHAPVQPDIHVLPMVPPGAANRDALPAT
jgi:acetolactate synthase-1/2/3 large subunit